MSAGRPADIVVLAGVVDVDTVERVDEGREPLHVDEGVVLNCRVRDTFDGIAHRLDTQGATVRPASGERSESEAVSRSAAVLENFSLASRSSTTLREIAWCALVSGLLRDGQSSREAIVAETLSGHCDLSSGSSEGTSAVYGSGRSLKIRRSFF
jgi:hypothetical protein